MFVNSCCCFFKDPGIIPRSHKSFQAQKIPSKATCADEIKKVEVESFEEKKPKKRVVNILFPELGSNDDYIKEGQMLETHNDPRENISKQYVLISEIFSRKIKRRKRRIMIRITVIYLSQSSATLLNLRKKPIFHQFLPKGLVILAISKGQRKLRTVESVITV